ncbi:hypothetical protein [Mesorhizobium sp. M1B.F.Ca.ET.045.04.1.1]|uniref:hypothetical protein n=1 Tax=Mesorhizobium sp. M1B.F.Ca.ET.045.04.1.1 TaxID=2493673 RepID=UPI000F74FFEF|nr:hypothetical protein [Mesorhizobium sp. M1B.F.Ca.ET.045.04.1.1]AZO32431.1 hypothetical protein EJ071_37215 [Mesorhizobium sp. M1B.F.Ca.ET.045.04.1.1]
MQELKSVILSDMPGGEMPILAPTILGKPYPLTADFAHRLGVSKRARNLDTGLRYRDVPNGGIFAGILRVSKATLARSRVLGSGLGYVKKQGRILYRAETVEKFVTSKERTKTRGV